VFSLCRLVNVAEPQAPMAEISYFTEKSGVRQILNMKDATQMYAIDKHQMSEIFCTRKDVATFLQRFMPWLENHAKENLFC